MPRGIAFLPWVTTNKERRIGGFRLVPYRIGTVSSTAIPHAHIDRALRFYREARRKPINECVLLVPAKKQIGEELTDGEIEDLFIFGELLAFSALAQRRLFHDHFGYIGRDHYALIFQRIPEQFTGSIALTYRRRDGGITHGISAEDYPIPIPAHVFGQAVLAYDEPLLKGLLAAWAEAPAKHWQRYYEAVNAFNLANTDSESVPAPMELVLLHGAFERALGVAGSKTNDFVIQLGKTVRVKGRVRCRKRGAIRPKPKQGEPFVLEAWARDFCVARGSVAHGHNYAAAKTTWSLLNHLLLATFLLPLLTKRCLAHEGVMSVREADSAMINAFERLACFDHFAHRAPFTTSPWRRVMADVELRVSARKLVRQLTASSRVSTT